MNKRTVASAFRTAASKFESGEWKRIRGRLGSNGVYCALGGVIAACGLEGKGLFESGIKDGFRKNVYPGGIDLLVCLNDNPGTSDETVIKRMRDIAYALEHGGKDRAGNKVDYV
jgi:hypothetical protein